MSTALFLILSAICVGLIVRGVMIRGGSYHYPFFAAGMFFSFILPQIPGLLNDRFLSEQSLSMTLCMACLAIVMCHVGWQVGSRIGSRPPTDSYSERRLLYAALALSLIGGFFFYQFGQLPDEQRLRGQLTGTAVAILFFAKLLTYGLAIALICCVNRRSYFALAIIAFDTAFYLHRIVIAGRRGETAEFFLMIAIAFWFRRGWAIPRPLVLLGLLASVLAMLGAKEYREATWYGDKTDFAAVMHIDLGKNWERLQQQGGVEIRNAAQMIEQANRTENYDFGLPLWNALVFAYVPAQLVGQSLKNGLLIDLPSLFPAGYEAGVGETYTGLADAFVSFWYLGCLKFFLIAFILGRIYRSALLGNERMQIVYMLSATPSMLVISHFTNEIVISWIHMAAFVFPILHYAKMRDWRVTSFS